MGRIGRPDAGHAENAAPSSAFGDTHHATPDATLTEKQLAAYLTAEGYRNLRIEAIEPGIEDCYMKLDRTNE